VKDDAAASKPASSGKVVAGDTHKGLLASYLDCSSNALSIFYLNLLASLNPWISLQIPVLNLHV
jgi:hypothetical protein